MLKTLLSATAITLTLAGSAFANEFKIGNLMIDHPVARATAPGAKVGGGYVTIKNMGNTADRLIGGSALFAGKVEIHEMKMENDIMKMKPIEGGLEIPAGGEVKLLPGGNHIMFMRLTEALEAGKPVKATLKFEKAGEAEVTFNVLTIAETMKLKGSHKMKMNHN